MHYICGGCGRPIGLMADKIGNPIMYKCVHTGIICEPQVAVSRKTPKRSKNTERQEC